MDGYPAPPTWARELSTVGVTGTNGKTSTVSWVAAALRTADPHAVCITTLGHRVGEEQVDVPADYGGFVQAMELSRARGGCHAAIELTSMALGLGFWRGWPCKVGVLTNFSRDHLDVHGSAEHYLACKAQLFVQLPVGGVAVLNADDPASALLAEVIPDGVRVLRYGCGDQADLRASDIRASWQGTQATLTGHPSLEPLPPTLQLAAIGDIYVYNAMAALLAAHALSVPAEVAAKALGRAPPPPGRFEVVARSPRPSRTARREDVMTLIAIAICLVLCAVGLLGVAAPSRLVGFVRSFQTPAGLLFAAALRVVLGKQIAAFQ